jgi:hypothetical protein
LLAFHCEIYVDQGTTKGQDRFANCYDQYKWSNAVQQILVWAVMTDAIYDYVHSATHNEDEATNVQEKQLIVVVSVTLEPQANMRFLKETQVHCFLRTRNISRGGNVRTHISHHEEKHTTR